MNEFLNYIIDSIRRSRIYMFLMICMICGAYLLTGFYRVGLEQAGIILRLGKIHHVMKAGLHYKLPYPVDELILIDVGQARCMIKTRSQDMRNRDNDNGQTSRKVEAQTMFALTGDESIAELSFNVIWTIKDPIKYTFSAREPDFTLQVAANSILREVIARHMLDRILTIDRNIITQEIQIELQEFMDMCDLGIHINEVQLGRIDPPAHVVYMEDDKKNYCVIDIYREVQRAKADFERSKNDAESYANFIIPESRGKAESLLKQATSYKARKMAEANGEAYRFDLLRRVYEKYSIIVRAKMRAELRKKMLQETRTIVGDVKNQAVIGWDKALNANEK